MACLQFYQSIIYILNQYQTYSIINIMSISSSNTTNYRYGPLKRRPSLKPDKDQITNPMTLLKTFHWSIRCLNHPCSQYQLKKMNHFYSIQKSIFVIQLISQSKFFIYQNLIILTQFIQQMASRILEYRNGMYQGQAKGNKRHGQGILITDDNIIIAGEWRNDLMTGKGFVLLSPEHCGYGEFNRGEIEGYFLFRTKNKTLFSEFNLSRPINKMVLMNNETEKVQTIIHKTPIFEVINEKPMGQGIYREQQEIYNALGIKFHCHSLLDFLQLQLCQAKSPKRSDLDRNQSSISLSGKANEESHFKMKPLNNGNTLFYYDDPTNPACLGLCFGKNQIVSCGVYVNDKLTGLGCKYENSVRYEGMFEGGFINGIGLKYSQGKYSFGQFENGNLVEALYIDDRSTISEQKLKQFKKAQHIRSLWYQNSYIRKSILKFRGINELVFEMNSQQEFMYPVVNNILSSMTKNKQRSRQFFNLNNSTSINAQLNRSTNSYNSNVQNSGSKNLALNMIIKKQGDKLETKSTKQAIIKPNLFQSRNTNDNMQDREMNMRKPTNNMNMDTINTKTSLQNYSKFNLNRDSQYKNPQDEEDIMIDEGRSSSGLRKLRKFKY